MQRKSLITIAWITFFIGNASFVFFTPMKTWQNYLVNMAFAFLYSFTIAVGNGVVNDYLSRKYPWETKTRIRTILGIIATLIVNIVLVLICDYINFIWFQGRPMSKFFEGSMALSHWLTINIALLISAILHASGFMKALKSSTQKQVIRQKFIAKAADARFESLKNQLDPHFLFNSLNVLDALIDENPPQAQRFTASMSKIYRYVLDQKDKETVTVAEEVDFARTYAELLKTRFEDSVLFTFNIAAEAENRYVVPLSLQLLLENCIKHNFATAQKPLHITIKTEKETLIVENTLQPRPVISDREGIGLANIVQRYALLTKAEVIVEETPETFAVHIPLLHQKQNIMNATEHTEDEAYRKAARRVRELKSFYSNLISYCLVIPFLIFVNLMTSREYYWFWWPMLGWGLGLSFHAMQTFGVGRNWEEKQIEKILNQNKK